MRQKLVRLSEEAMTVGLKININKTKQLRVNTENVNPLHIENQPIELVEHFVYLVSVIDKEGGTDTDIKATKSKESFWNS